MEVSPKSHIFCLQFIQNTNNYLIFRCALHVSTCRRLYLVVWQAAFPRVEPSEHLHYYVNQLDEHTAVGQFIHVGSLLKETDSLLSSIQQDHKFVLSINTKHIILSRKKKKKKVWRSGCSPATPKSLATEIE